MTTYRLKYIADLLDVPDDRLDACLAELRELMPIMRQQMSGFAAVARSAVECTGLEWVDDGAGDVTTRFATGETHLATVKLEGALKPERTA